MKFDKTTLEKYSSAITLSDMEIFVFPELMYSLVLANIMSPVLWKWRDEDSFKKLDGKTSYRKIMRMKQFIMDEYEFNLDLETWGLTHSQTELKRFKDVISPDDIAKSNALFGYHGDQYYFDVDIRKHFGLDKYNSEIIPYWKTETIEAMDAFRYKQGYTTGAGECVSLAGLYAAAAFVVCGVPLEDIFMILTPLHSQNFLDVADGIITNNRRIVTKTMWFNGTAISDKAQRAIRNEKVTIVGHSTGYVHTFFDSATIDPSEYLRFEDKLNSYLYANLDLLNLVNFLRCHGEYQKYFQFCRHFRGYAKFVKAETMFHYEHGSQFRIADDTYDKLLNDVDEDDYSSTKHIDRICCEQLRQFLGKKEFNLKVKQHLDDLASYLKPFVPDAENFVQTLSDFLTISPQLPDKKKKQFNRTEPIKLNNDMDRQAVIEYLSSMRDKNITVDLAFYAYRDMARCDWQPFIKAAVERNPVSVEMLKDKSVGEIYDWLKSLDNASIYDGSRVAQPDEVANFVRGDGVEKAFLLANIIKSRNPGEKIRININNDCVMLKNDKNYYFSSNKRLQKELEI